MSDDLALKVKWMSALIDVATATEVFLGAPQFAGNLLDLQAAMAALKKIERHNVAWTVFDAKYLAGQLNPKQNTVDRQGLPWYQRLWRQDG